VIAVVFVSSSYTHRALFVFSCGPMGLALPAVPARVYARRLARFPSPCGRKQRARTPSAYLAHCLSALLFAPTAFAMAAAGSAPPAAAHGAVAAPAPAVGAGAPPAAPNPAAAAAAARQGRVDRIRQLKERRADLKKEQKELAKQEKKETQAYSRAAKKMKTLDTALILQHLRERGENV
jgi:hypothetical protein